MQNEWWYSLDGRRAGPISANDLRQLLIIGTLAQSTLVWKEGLSEWLPISQVEVFASILRALPPELPKALTEKDLRAVTSAGPWRRFFARIIDLWILAIPTTFGAAYALASMYPAFAVWIQRPGSAFVLGWLLLPLTLSAEAVVFGIFGTTPGKALLAIAVRTSTGTKLSFAEYVRRQIRLYWFGLGTGFPFVSVVTMALQRRRLKAGKQARYDDQDFSVQAPKLNFGRGAFATLVIAGLMVLNALPLAPSMNSSIPAERPTSSTRAPEQRAIKSPTYDAKGWTQESTDSVENGPWLRYSPPGTRYYRDANRVIYRVYPPGVKPNAEPANPFGLGDSKSTVPE
ncbi:MAG: RDD family protein [Rubrivivax sp.]|nr:RDD family protein [Rubrivivax sp.]